MSAENIRLLETGKTDAQIASELRAELTAKITAEILPILDRASVHGIQVGFAIGMGPFGKNVIQAINLSKPL